MKNIDNEVTIRGSAVLCECFYRGGDGQEYDIDPITCSPDQVIVNPGEYYNPKKFGGRVRTDGIIMWRVGNRGQITNSPDILSGDDLIDQYGLWEIDGGESATNTWSSGYIWNAHQNEVYHVDMGGKPLEEISRTFKGYKTSVTMSTYFDDTPGSPIGWCQRIGDATVNSYKLAYEAQEGESWNHNYIGSVEVYQKLGEDMDGDDYYIRFSSQSYFKYSSSSAPCSAQYKEYLDATGRTVEFTCSGIGIGIELQPYY